MQIPMAAQIWVQFDRNKKPEEIPESFQLSRTYPVFAIDVVDLDDGQKETSFLLSGNDYKFRWVNADLLRRMPPKYDNPQSNHAGGVQNVHTRKPALTRA